MTQKSLDYMEETIRSNYWTLHKYTETVEGRVEKLEERVNERTSDNQDTLAEVRQELVKFRAILIDQEERIQKIEERYNLPIMDLTGVKVSKEDCEEMRKKYEARADMLTGVNRMREIAKRAKKK